MQQGLRVSNDEERARLPELLSELDAADAEASVEDVESIRKIVKRLAPEKNEITGQPGVDYPALTTIPTTSFSCRGQKGGYYADLETNCQVFHICDNGRKISFLCPNGTIFQQSQLICDWWFKVDCSRSAELYEQSAEILAEEERKRLETKKMNSEFHRTNNNNNNFDQNFAGHQNGRSNPYSQSASQNQLPVHQSGKSTQFDDNQVYERQNIRQGGQSTHSNGQTFQDSSRPKDIYSKQSNRQQNQLVSNDGKSSQLNNFERGSNKFYNHQVKSSQEDEYFGSAANVNAQRQDKQSVKSTKPRTFTRQSFNNPIPKVTPAYTETTTFRTSTTSPIREFQQLAESAAFASSRGNRYRAQSSNSFNSFYSNNKGTTKSPETTQQSSTSVTGTQQDQNDPRSLAKPRGGVPAFPGPTYTPIYKPKTTTTTSPKEAATTTLRSYMNTDYFRQGSQEQSTRYNLETTTSYPQFTTKDSRTIYTTIDPWIKNTNPIPTSSNDDSFTTSNPTTQRSYNPRDFYRETTTLQPFTTTTNYENKETTTWNDDGFTGSFTTQRPVYVQGPGQTTTVPDIIYSDKATTRASSPFNDIQAQNSVRYGSPQFSTKTSEKINAYRPNEISASTQKSVGGMKDGPHEPRRTPFPYDTSITYQHGRIMSTLGPYLPFTKSYAFTSASTTSGPVYTPTSSSSVKISKTPRTSLRSENYVSSSYGKSGTRATYLPEKTTQLAVVTEKAILNNRPANEREHALDMLKSLQGLEGAVPNLDLNRVNRPKNGAEIPNSSGPSTLHSLALYFANAEDLFDNERSTDSLVNVEFFETTPYTIEEKNTSVVDLPESILTQHTIHSYAELFNLNNALENNVTGDTSYDDSDENLTDEDPSDLDIQQSEGPLSGVKKSNNTKLRELAQVFTQALSFYLKDPDTFKKVLTEIRPTEPPKDSDNEIATASQTTTEDYPSVTKEKDEVLDFSDDNNAIRRRRPTTTPLPVTNEELVDLQRETTYLPYYTPEYFSTTSSYPDESLNEAQSRYLLQPQNKKSGIQYAPSPNDKFDSKNNSELRNSKSNVNSLGGSDNSGKNYENYFPDESSSSRKNSSNTYAPYGKYVKPSDATPISDNYVASSTPATYEIAALRDYPPQNSNVRVTDNVHEELSPPRNHKPEYTDIPHSTTLNDVSKTRSASTQLPGSTVTPVYKKPQENSRTTKESFRIRYYDTTTPRQSNSESLVTANSINPSYLNNYNSLSNDAHQTERSVPNHKHSQSNRHWTSSPTVTQLWETTVFIDPDHINRGLDEDFRTHEPSGIDHRSTTPSSRNIFQADLQNSVTPQNYLNDLSTPWQWASNNNDSPTAFTLLPSVYSNTENTATPSPTYATRSSITTTLKSSITTNPVPTQDRNRSTKISVFNVTENEIQRAQEMFGGLNETSSNTLMNVMKQADSNATVRQLVLLLISHCNGPMNKTMEEEKEQLLNALLRLPVNEFTSEESRELIKGISKLHLPIGKSSESNNPTTPLIKTSTAPSTTVRAPASEPAVTTFRNRSNRKYKTTTSKPAVRQSGRQERLANPKLRNSVALDEESASDNRALDLLRSLYTIAAKWG
ncbi:hypothetical protein QAD02_014500 [Eretmocerus hayati]|uniref:Uncharacterized protein n=1 Tax=Eretmocerus hayati TaxID=131215 RepID=A0ACC2P5H1_9HYME|nr:hypothetical protein QAD02_014500 [Eretmocerus hayati]